MRVGFLDGNINQTLLWLCPQPPNDQDKIVTFCIKQARKVRHVYVQNIAKIQINEEST